MASQLEALALAFPRRSNTDSPRALSLGRSVQDSFVPHPSLPFDIQTIALYLALTNIDATHVYFGIVSLAIHCLLPGVWFFFPLSSA